MIPRRPRTLFAFAAALALVLAACGGGGGAGSPVLTSMPPTTAPDTPAPQTQQVATTDAPTEAAQPEDLPECDGSVDEMEFGSTVQGQTEGEDLSSRTRFYCVEVPTGVDSFTITLTDLTSNLDLFAAYGDFASLVDGGFALRYSDTSGTEDETITIDIDPDLVWSPGAYYIEVSPSNIDDSPFTLTVAIP